MIARSRSKAWRQLGEIRKPVRGPAVILSDGDAVFQPRKVERSGLWRAVDDRVLIYIHNGASAREFRKIILSDAAMTNISAEGLLSHAVRSLRCNFDARAATSSQNLDQIALSSNLGHSNPRSRARR